MKDNVEAKSVKIALAGNPNSGKTTVFNNLTGGRQHVGNWPGVTVEKKEGTYTHNSHEVTVVDLPGIYSLTAYSLDERIARDFLIREKPDAVVVVIDASNLERNHYLVTQLLELGAKVILDLNMMDMVRSRGVEIDTGKLSAVLDIPVIETVAFRGEGMEELKEAIAKAKAERGDSLKIDYDHDIEGEIEKLQNAVALPGYPSRWVAVKLLEGDAEVLKMVEDTGIAPLVLEAQTRLERHLGYDLETALVERRYAFLSGLVRESTKKRLDLMERLDLSDRIDRVLVNRFLGIPIFLAMMWLVFQLVFTLGAPLAEGIDLLMGWLGEGVSSGIGAVGGPRWLSSLLSDGIIGGVGSVLVFLPNIMLLFLAIAILEASGYMARAAFVMDRLMHALGLHGKSFIPMLLGFGCNIPGIMATRTLESEKDRILTILVNPLMSCSARLPIYVLFAGAFFPRNQGLVIFSLYLMGIILAVVVARIFKGIFFKGEVAPLIMELPPYRLPTIKGVLVHMWERSSLFLRKAGTIIFLGVVLIWFLASLPFGVEYASQESVIGRLGSVFAPLLKPAGFGFWQAGVALSFGILAKEVVVGTLGTLYGVEEAGLTGVIQAQFTALSAYAFMVMALVYIPCIAAIATIKRETNWKWTALAVGYSLVLGWGLAVLIYQIGAFIITLT
ncbi:MAG: ferrous iron transport protein B [Deltaproteobacteria bacterium]|nr:MAG: ferrous iron transport protein B [Deltaproteobacteria bacterium]